MLILLPSVLLMLLSFTATAPNPRVQEIAECMSINIADTTSQDILAIIPSAIAFIGESVLSLSDISAS